ncbi:MAG: DUF1553 domain-containing protein [Planctomycetaceae bacterium]|nr:DUF1553 domain-containing protein [Planctomycetaceae bacterium]MCB9953974.1 DUF1553 domain-containing protein [Planctomycetaceae bacterium]
MPKYFLFLACCLAASVVRAEAPVSFRDDIEPLLQRKCLGCHNDRDNKGDFSLQLRENVIGVHVEPKDAAGSYLLDLVTSQDADERMPPEGEALSSLDVDLLRRWIESGAEWPEGHQIKEPVVTDTNWWSLQPLTTQKFAGDGNPIDWYVERNLKAAGMSLAAPASPRVLVRRLYFDLTGLPPTPEEVEAFEANPSPQAYQELVDRLLASPHYGERWARHWLDVVHYGETHGYDKDKMRPNAWPYRDYVIRALNDDVPYETFIRQQLAGDVLFPEQPEAIEALGFIAAGPWDFIGHAEVPETKIDGKIARHLDRDDMVQNTISTFCSLTVGCAQCHNHKFDPITQADYYGLHAVFAALDRADKQYDRNPEVADQRRELLAEQSQLEQQADEVKTKVAEHVGTSLDTVHSEMARLLRMMPRHPPEHGYHSQIESDAGREKWVQVDLGEPRSFTEVVLHPCFDDFNGIGEGFGFPVRFRVEASNSSTFEGDVTLLHDAQSEDVANPRLNSIHIACKDTQARYVRMTATRLVERKKDFIFALSELEVFDSSQQNIAAGAKVNALDSIEAPIRWGVANLTDGKFPTSGYSESDWQKLEAEKKQILAEKVPAELLEQERAIQQQLAAVQTRMKALPAPQLVYAGTVHTGKGNFVGTGNQGGRPREIHVLHRGDVKRPGEVAVPAGIPGVPGLSAEFDLPEDAPESSRRVALANWIAHRDNPLTWRSIVNRVWQYHFGRGLVETSSDFGRMGSLPSHPELLDDLAIWFRDDEQSLKALHRLIVTSRTYQQAASNAKGDEFAKVDSENRLLWKFPARRHDAEVLRDSMLAVSGLLDPKMGGPSFQDFVIEHPEHSPHYEYHLHDPHDPACHRRSIYRFIVRSKTQPFMTVMDCADPSMQVERRNETNSPLQALALLNDGLVLVCSEALAKQAEANGDPGTQLDTMFLQVLQRRPTDEELEVLSGIQQRDGNVALARILLNLNEFAFQE